MRKGLRGFVDDALSRTGPLAVEKSGDFPTARPFAHKLHRALFVLYKIPEGQNQPYHRSVDHNWQGSTYQSTFSVQTNGATSLRLSCRKPRHYGAATPLVRRAWRRRRPCSSGELIL